MSQGPNAAPAGGAAGGVAVTPSQMFEALHVATPLPPLQAEEPIASIAIMGICFKKYVVLIQEYPPCARTDRLIVPSAAVLLPQCPRSAAVNRSRGFGDDDARARIITRTAASPERAPSAAQAERPACGLDRF